MAHRVAVLLTVVVTLAACGAHSSPAADANASPSPPTRVDEMIADPAGDAEINPGETPPGYVDSVAMGVDKTGDTFLFAFQMAAPIPSSFTPPAPYNALLWSFCLDTDELSSPDGYPFVNIGPVPCDFIVTAHSEGGPVTGTLMDRRPLARGKDAVTTEIPVTIDGANALITVPAASLGNPGAFAWAMSVSAVTFPLPNNDFIDIDADYEHMHRYP
jgi:hypothetical protein